jgi:hypothetical protein
MSVNSKPAQSAPFDVGLRNKAANQPFDLKYKRRDIDELLIPVRRDDWKEILCGKLCGKIFMEYHTHKDPDDIYEGPGDYFDDEDDGDFIKLDEIDFNEIYKYGTSVVKFTAMEQYILYILIKYNIKIESKYLAFNNIANPISIYYGEYMRFGHLRNRQLIMIKEFLLYFNSKWSDANIDIIRNIY